MSDYDLMKLFSQFDGEVTESDFTPEELMEYLAYREGEERPMTISRRKPTYIEKSDAMQYKRRKKQDW